MDLRQSLGLNPNLSDFKIHGLCMPYPAGCLTEYRHWGSEFPRCWDPQCWSVNLGLLHFSNLEMSWIPAKIC